MPSCTLSLLALALVHACCCSCARARLAFVSPEWGETVNPSVSIVIQDLSFSHQRGFCQFYLALNQQALHSGPVEHEFVSIALTLAPGYYQLAVYTSTPPSAGSSHDLAVADKALEDTVLFTVRRPEALGDERFSPAAPVLSCPQHSFPAPPEDREFSCRVLQRSGGCELLLGTCDQWRSDQTAIHRGVDARTGSLSTSDSAFWFQVDSCIYNVLAIAAQTISASRAVPSSVAFDAALFAAAAVHACPRALRSGAWTRAFERDTSANRLDNLRRSASVFFIVVSGTSFMKHRARAVRCSWAAHALNVLLISGQNQVFVDRCSQLHSATLPAWHAVRAAHAISSPNNLSSRALLHDDFFSSIPKFMLSLLLAWQLNPSADWYYTAGCDTAAHPAALAALLEGLDPSRRLLVGGHAGLTRLLRSQLFLSGGAGLALSRAAMRTLVPVIEDFTEMWLLQEGAASGCIPCADIALQRLCEGHGIQIVELEGFYAHPPSHYLGSSVLDPQFTDKFPWQQMLPQCHNALRQHVGNQSFQDALQSMDGRWGRSRRITSHPVAFHYLGPRRLHQTWLLLQTLHALHSKAQC